MLDLLNDRSNHIIVYLFDLFNMKFLYPLFPPEKLLTDRKQNYLEKHVA